MDESVLREVFGTDFDRLEGPAYRGDLLPDLFRPYVVSHGRFRGPDDTARVEAFRLTAETPARACSSTDGREPLETDPIAHGARRRRSAAFGGAIDRRSA
jgi:hypothetical protein